MAIVLVAGVLVCAVAVLGRNGGTARIAPAFAPSERGAVRQVVQIVMLAPWAFVGFESISNSTQGFKFSPKKSIWIMLAALVAGSACYVLPALIAASAVPSGYADWTGYLADLDERIGRYAEEIHSAGNTLLYIINDILDLSRIEAGRMELTPTEYMTAAVLNDVANMTAQKARDKGLAYELLADPDIPAQLYGDDIRVRQILLNLVNNAVKFTDAGSVRIHVSYDRARGTLRAAKEVLSGSFRCVLVRGEEKAAQYLAEHEVEFVLRDGQP